MKIIYQKIQKLTNYSFFLKEICNFIYKEGYVTKNFYKFVKKRDKLASLYMGNGLIIPHPSENGRKEIINQGCIPINWFDKPIKYENNDVYFSITIAIKSTQHMDILSKIAIIFSDSKKVGKLLKDKSEKNIRKVLNF